MIAITAPATTKQPPMRRRWLSGCSLSWATMLRQPFGATKGPIPSTINTSPIASQIDSDIAIPCGFKKGKYYQ
ncbi:hypothetical protein THZG08_410039 [Vibrio owensii]|nr:hypothetical protein THZG08_410039 [Vibrio owensii]CAH1564523.1 hypothetical protein THZB04_190038 [Vibrio owensii]CAH1578271.1 hypothetical protein THOA03_410039 [Vibrio owensii]